MAAELVPCTDGCREGWMDPSRSVTVKMPRLDADGKPVLNREQQPTFVFMKRVYHVLHPSRLAEYPLVPAACVHGLPVHPDRAMQAWAGGRGHSWIKSSYVGIDGLCVMDHGQERPDDLTCGL